MEEGGGGGGKRAIARPFFMSRESSEITLTF